VLIISQLSTHYNIRSKNSMISMTKDPNIIQKYNKYKTTKSNTAFTCFLTFIPYLPFRLLKIFKILCFTWPNPARHQLVFRPTLLKSVYLCFAFLPSNGQNGGIRYSRVAARGAALPLANQLLHRRRVSGPLRGHGLPVAVGFLLRACEH
jgi:hypothetical protein